MTSEKMAANRSQTNSQIWSDPMIFAATSAARAVSAALAVSVALSAGSALADAEAGREDFRTRCAACHGPTGEGDGPVAAQLKTPPVDLTVLRDENGGVFPRDQVIAVIDGRDWLDAHGARAMPIWGEIFEAQASKALEGQFSNPEDLVIERVEDIVDYIETLQR